MSGPLVDVDDYCKLHHAPTTTATYKNLDKNFVDLVNLIEPGNRYFSRDGKLLVSLTWITVSNALGELIVQMSDREIPRSSAFFEAQRTTVNRLHTDSRRAILAEVADGLTKFIKGYKRREAMLRQEGILSSSPGGDALDMAVWRRLLMYLWINATSEVIAFAHVLMNIGVRGDNGAWVHQSHLDLAEDMMTCRVPYSKVVGTYVPFMSVLFLFCHFCSFCVTSVPALLTGVSLSLTNTERPRGQGGLSKKDCI